MGSLPNEGNSILVPSKASPWDLSRLSLITKMAQDYKWAEKMRERDSSIEKSSQI